MCEINLIKEEELNSFYNPVRSNNGGGYHQPLHEYDIRFKGKKFTLIKEDTSCGDFGKRLHIEIKDEFGNSIFNFFKDEVNKVPELYSRYNYRYPAVIKYLIEEGYLNIEYLLKRFISVGAWESYWYNHDKDESFVRLKSLGFSNKEIRKILKDC